jgi:hypothetical protein
MSEARRRRIPVEADDHAAEVLIERLEAIGLSVLGGPEPNGEGYTITFEIPETSVDDPFAFERDSEGNLDHTNEYHLRWAYETHDSLDTVAKEFAVDYNAVRHQLVKREIHEPKRYNTGGSE